MRARRIVVTVIAVLVGIVVLQSPASGSGSHALTESLAALTSESDAPAPETESAAGNSGGDTGEHTATESDNWLPVGIVVAVLAIGGLLLLSPR